MRRLILIAALTLFATLAAADEVQYTIFPALGPATGGTKVTIRGSFGFWPYGVTFGDAEATSVARVDEHTLTAVTPEHVSGIVEVRIFEYDLYLSTDLTYEFMGRPEREQLLLPVFLEPLKGAYGSEFRTELNGLNTSNTQVVEVWGLETTCHPSPPACDWLREPMVYLNPWRDGTDLSDYRVYQTGSPGRYIEVPRDQIDDFAMTLRVYDTSRSAENFGTEIPVVRTSDFHRNKIFALLDVPLDSRFRKMLRLYATGPTTVDLLVGNDTYKVQLEAGAHVFDPAYAQFTAFPKGTGTIRVLASVKKDGPAVWGFITVTNNETQQITTITPR